MGEQPRLTRQEPWDIIQAFAEGLRRSGEAAQDRAQQLRRLELSDRMQAMGEARRNQMELDTIPKRRAIELPFKIEDEERADRRQSARDREVTDNNIRQSTETTRQNFKTEEELYKSNPEFYNIRRGRRSAAEEKKDIDDLVPFDPTKETRQMLPRDPYFEKEFIESRKKAGFTVERYGSDGRNNYVILRNPKTGEEIVAPAPGNAPPPAPKQVENNFQRDPNYRPPEGTFPPGPNPDPMGFNSRPPAPNPSDPVGIIERNIVNPIVQGVEGAKGALDRLDEITGAPTWHRKAIDAITPQSGTPKMGDRPTTGTPPQPSGGLTPLRVRPDATTDPRPVPEGGNTAPPPAGDFRSRYAPARNRQEMQEAPPLSEESQGLGGALRGKGEKQSGPLPQRQGLISDVVNAFVNAGFSEQGAAILAGEVGRENSFRPDLIFGSHSDPHNRVTNAGLFSWQKDRRTQLMSRLTEEGLVRNGRIIPSQAALDVMAEFARDEMQSMAPQTLRELTSDNPNYDRAVAGLGRKYIKWRFDDPKYSAHHGHRDRWFERANQQLRRPRTRKSDGVPQAQRPTVVATNDPDVFDVILDDTELA